MFLRVATGVAFLVAGILEILFLGLSILGTGLGGVMTIGAFAGELRNEEALLGPLVLVFYAVWLVVTALAGPLHVVAGAWMLVGTPRRGVIWAATVGSMLPLVTVYCAPTAILAGVLGLVWLITTQPRSS